MKCSNTILSLTLLLAANLTAAQIPRSHYDPAPAHATGQQKGFVEFVFSRINPQNIDYGMRIEEFRASVLDATVRDVSFWADAFAAGLLVLSFGIIVWQQRRIHGMRFSTARIVTGYHCELTQARDQIARLSAEYNTIKRAADEEKEETFFAKPQPAGRENSARDNGKSPVKLAAIATQTAAPGGDPNPELAKANQTIGSLRKQVNALSRRLDEEQNKNRKLRGE